MSTEKIEGLKAQLADAEREHAERALFPKWVAVHESHITRKSGDGVADHVSVALWPEFHVARDGAVTVLVKDQGEEDRALAAAPEPVADEPVAEVIEPVDPVTEVAKAENPAEKTG